MKKDFSRRDFLRTGSLLAAGGVTAGLAGGCGEEQKLSQKKPMVENQLGSFEKFELKGNINHSVCKWVFWKTPLHQFCQVCNDIGLKSIELLQPGKNLDTVQKHGLTCAMVSSHALKKGMCNKNYHGDCLDALRNSIEAASAHGMPNVVSFSGNREGIPDDVGVENAVAGYKQVVGLAEKKNVTICIEYLNSKVDHADYMFDNMAWGVEVCKRVGSPNLKILYDIYHAQIMEGDVIRTIQDYHEYIGHYHTAGNPGRNEMDETQELYYPAIMKAILETGYTGFVGHEFVITWSDPVKALAHAVKTCDV